MTAEPQLVAEITSAIQQSLPGADVHVSDPRRDGKHLEVLVVSEKFEGLRLLQQHRLVMEPLSDFFGERLHACQIKTLTPARWEEISQSQLNVVTE